MSRTEFAAAFGEYALSEIELGGLIGAGADTYGRLREAEEALIALRSPHRAGIVGKLERVAEHVRDYDYGRLECELAACIQELATSDVRLAHSAIALEVLARRFARVDLPSVWIRFLRSARADALALARLE